MARDSYIRRIEIFPVAYPVHRRFKFLHTPRGLPAGRRTVVVKITDQEGRVGWGQAVPSHLWSYETPETVRSTLEHYLVPALVGRDTADGQILLGETHFATGPSFSVGHQIAKSALEMALWDLRGKRLGLSVAALLRLRKPPEPIAERVTLSWTVNEETPDDAERSIAEAHELGYRHFNVKLNGDVESDLTLCRVVIRSASGGFIWADANCGYYDRVDDVMAIAPKLADLGFAALEQPLRANYISGYQRLHKQGAISILLDESISTCDDFDEFHALGLMNGAAVKVSRMGGIGAANTLCRRLRETKLLAYASGLTDPDLALAASLHVFAAAGITLPAALNGPQFLTGTILRKPLVPHGDQLAVPTGPGLGVEVDEDRLRELMEPQS
jgi:L-alanine-DL-glutamate epimerase-like enolase superfamily enzyme